MVMDIKTLIALVVPAAAVIVWLVRLEGRINVLDAKQSYVADTLKEIKDRTKELAGDVKELLRRQS